MVLEQEIASSALRTLSLSRVWSEVAEIAKMGGNGARRVAPTRLYSLSLISGDDRRRHGRAGAQFLPGLLSVRWQWSP